jgi:acyl-CoA synthetase (AMP-forming)/AMP-acid ligase II
LPIHAREALGLDLSSLRHCLNAAERIDPRTSAVFAAAFEACGYSPGAMFHGYGLAESVVYVCDGPSRSISICGSSLERDKRAVVVVATGIDGRASSVVDVRRVASVGAPRGDVEVCVVHAARRARCADGEVGEIWVRSASIASGFWRRDGGDADDDGAFGATLADDVDGKRGGAFLRTGDEGFARDGELFVTGRSKDLIVVGGRNFAPEDIERTIRDAEASEG